MQHRKCRGRCRCQPGQRRSRCRSCWTTRPRPRTCRRRSPHTRWTGRCRRRSCRPRSLCMTSPLPRRMSPPNKPDKGCLHHRRHRTVPQRIADRRQSRLPPCNRLRCRLRTVCLGRCRRPFVQRCRRYRRRRPRRCTCRRHMRGMTGTYGSGCCMSRPGNLRNPWTQNHHGHTGRLHSRCNLSLLRPNSDRRHRSRMLSRGCYHRRRFRSHSRCTPFGLRPRTCRHHNLRNPWTQNRHGHTCQLRSQCMRLNRRQRIFPQRKMCRTFAPRTR